MKNNFKKILVTFFISMIFFSITLNATTQSATEIGHSTINISTTIAKLVKENKITQVQADKVLAIIGNLEISAIKSGKEGQLSPLVQNGTLSLQQEQIILSAIGIGNSVIPSGTITSGGNIVGRTGGITSSIKTTAKYSNIVYGNDAANNKLDIYIPETGDGPYPIVFAIHGGAFKSGSKTGGDIAYIIDNSVDNGYAVVAVDYRLSGVAKAPAAVNDIKAAIRYIRANSGKYNIDGTKIAAWGGSAGGNLASMIGTTGDVSNLTVGVIIDTLNADIYPTQSTVIQAVVDWFGPIYFSSMDEEFVILGITNPVGITNTASSPESEYIGKEVGKAEAEPFVKAASPQNYITVDDAAFLIQHGDNDKNIPYLQSKNFAIILENILGPEKVIFQIVSGGGHGDAVFTTNVDKNTIFDFLKKNLGIIE